MRASEGGWLSRDTVTLQDYSIDNQDGRGNSTITSRGRQSVLPGGLMYCADIDCIRYFGVEVYGCFAESDREGWKRAGGLGWTR